MGSWLGLGVTPLTTLLVCALTCPIAFCASGLNGFPSSTTALDDHPPFHGQERRRKSWAELESATNIQGKQGMVVLISSLSWSVIRQLKASETPGERKDIANLEVVTQRTLRNHPQSPPCADGSLPLGHRTFEAAFWEAYYPVTISLRIQYEVTVEDDPSNFSLSIWLSKPRHVATNIALHWTTSLLTMGQCPARVSEPPHSERRCHLTTGI